MDGVLRVELSRMERDERVCLEGEWWRHFIFLCINLLHPPLFAGAACLWVAAPGKGATFDLVVELKRRATVPAMFCALSWDVSDEAV